MAGIYEADVFCDDCIDCIKDRICDELWAQRETSVCPDGTNVVDFESRDDLYDYLVFMDDRTYDSGDYPKHCDDDQEYDCPQHCGSGADCCNPSVTSDGEKYGYFFENSLTSDGEDYVKETVNEDRRAGRNDSPACELWAKCYNYLDFDDLDDPDEFEPCEGDFTITPCGRLGAKSALGRVDGEFIGEFDDDSSAYAAAQRIMTEEQFWTDVWLVSDHGNWSRM